MEFSKRQQANPKERFPHAGTKGAAKDDEGATEYHVQKI